MVELANRTCKPYKTGTAPLSIDEIHDLLQKAECWTLTTNEEKAISRIFNFKNYYETIAFVNAIAWIAHQQDHHPDLEVSYNRCHVNFSTHSVGGLSENDFICAAKLNTLMIIK